MAFVIITDSQKNEEILFMVDRRKQRKSFWSNSLKDAMIYSNRIAAEQKAKQLLHNNPRVISLSETNEILRLQQLDKLYDEGFSSLESGWDGHKEVF